MEKQLIENGERALESPHRRASALLNVETFPNSLRSRGRNRVQVFPPWSGWETQGPHAGAVRPDGGGRNDLKDACRVLRLPLMAACISEPDDGPNLKFFPLIVPRFHGTMVQYSSPVQCMPPAPDATAANPLDGRPKSPDALDATTGPAQGSATCSHTCNDRNRFIDAPKRATFPSAPHRTHMRTLHHHHHHHYQYRASTTVSFPRCFVDPLPRPT